MPRCAVVVSTFRPVTGGYQRQLEAVFAELVESHGWDAHVITRAQPDSPARDFVGVLPVQRTGVSGVDFARGAIARLLALRPEVVVTAQLGSAALATSAYCRAARRPLVIRLAGSESLTGKRARLIRGLAPSSVLVAPSCHQLKAAADAGWPQRKQVLPNGIMPTANRADPGTYVLWYGRDTTAKNPQDLARLVQEAPDVAFLALGDASLAPAPNLVQAGWVDDVGATLAHAQAFVSTSRSEGSPNVALTAMAMGVPVVAFSNAAYEELQRAHPGHVRLVPFGDVAALGKAVHTAIRQGPREQADLPTIARVAQHWDTLMRGLL